MSERNFIQFYRFYSHSASHIYRPVLHFFYLPMRFLPDWAGLLSALLTGLLASTTLAQELWLEPARFWVPAGAAVHVRRLIGDNFQGRPWPGTSRRITGFWHCAPGAAIGAGLPTAPPTDTLRTTLTLLQPGTHLVALATDTAFTTLSAAEFAAYLRAAGLDYQLARRVQAGDTTRPVREAYRRCAKTLVQAGTPASPGDTAWARVLRLPLELVPEQNPYRLAAGAAFTVRVLAVGRPVAGLQVTLWRRGARPRALVSKLRSNQNGRVLFRLSEAGEYLVSTVSAEPAPRGSGADWQSTWSTLTFGLAGPKRP